MKLVKEHINEVFTQDSDPIHDLGIGILHHVHNFKTVSEAENFIIEILPLLLGTNEIQKDILGEKGRFLKNNYFNKILKFWEQHITVNNKMATLSPYDLGYKLYRKGFKVKCRNAIKQYRERDDSKNVKHI